jgi:hypothetical protein
MSPLRILAGLAFAGSCIFQASADDIVTSKSGYGGIIDARAFATDNATVTTTVLQDALDYAAAHGIGTVKLGARYTSTLGNINVPAYTKLDLGGASVGKITTTRNYTLASGIEGVLALGSAGTITCGVGATIQNGNILAAGGSYSPTTFYPTTTRDGQNVQTAEATAGTAITASSPSCHLNNLSILGFNVGAALSSQHIQLVDVFIDAKKCISLNGAEDDQYERVICKSLLTQGLDRQSTLLYLAGSGDGSNQYEFTWDVSATTYTLADGDKFYVVPDDGGGGESAAGGWPIISAATRANGEKGCNRVAGCAGGKLSGSSANATVLSASWSSSADLAGDYFVTVTPGTTGTVSVGQAVSGTGIASGTTVAAVWNDQGRIYLTPLAPATTPFTQAGSGISLTFTDHAFTASNTAFIENGNRSGAGFDCTNSSGQKITDSTLFAHDIGIHASDGCRNIRILNLTSGTNDSSLDDGQIVLQVDGSHTGDDADGIYVVSCNCGQHAQVGFKFNTDSNKPSFITTAVAAPGTAHIVGTALDVEDGKVVVNGLNTGGAAANIFIADGADVSTNGVTNAGTHYYVETPLGAALNGQNSQCTVLIVCNHTATIDVAALTKSGYGISSPIWSGFSSNTAPIVGVSNFTPLMNTAAPNASEAQVRGYAPFSGLIRNLQVRLSGAPGTNHSLVITLRQGANGNALSDSTLTCTIADPNLNCTDLTHSVTVAQGDYVDWSVTYDSTAATGSRVNITAEYDSQ